jgi:CHAD domain-containing protein
VVPADATSADPTITGAPSGVEPGSEPSPPLTVERLSATLAPRFTVIAGPLVQHLQLWLDTADWRVHKQGASLHVRSRPEGSDLVLRCADGGTLAEPVSASFAPPVARLIVDAPARAVRSDAGFAAALISAGPAGPAHATVPARVRIEQVRGYDSQARAVASALRRAGIPVSDTVSATEAYLALGLTPGVPPGSTRAHVAVKAETPAREFVAGALLAILDELEAAVPGTVADVDPEFLHDLRVAVRRSRSILKIAGDALPAGVSERFSGTLRWIGDLTTPVRDLDVHVLDFDADAARLEAFAPEDLEPLRAHLQRHRVAERRALVRGLRSARFGNFLTAWRTALVAAAESAPSGQGAGGERARREGSGDLRVEDRPVGDRPVGDRPVGDRPVGELAAKRVAAADRTVVDKGRKIAADTPAEKLHALRKRAKELRYTLELFAPVLDGPGTRTVIKELKGLQDMLGAFQDGEVQRMALRAFADQMVAEQTSQRPVPVVTLLAMGELATRLDEDEREARMAFDERFARFVRPRVRKQVASLIAGPVSGQVNGAVGSQVSGALGSPLGDGGA